MKSRGKGRILPSRNSLIPDAVYEKYTSAFEHTIAGSASVYYTPNDTIEQYPFMFGDSNPYDIMNKFASEHFDTSRVAHRVYKDTPINRFIFRMRDGKNYYELLVNPNSRSWYVVPSAGAFKSTRTVPTWNNVKL